MLTQFAAMTTNILLREGLDGYLPTLVLPDSKIIKALAEIPSGVDQRKAIQEWIGEHGPPEAFLFAVQSAEDEVVLGERIGSQCKFMNLKRNGDNFKAAPMMKPEWWYLTE